MRTEGESRPGPSPPSWYPEAGRGERSVTKKANHQRGQVRHIGRSQGGHVTRWGKQKKKQKKKAKEVRCFAGGNAPTASGRS